MWQCHYCRFPLPAEMQQRNRLCPNCGSDLHSCMNCVHYDENVSSKCKEPESPWIRDRAGQNTCPFFEFRFGQAVPHSGAATAEHHSEAEAAKKAFRALFRN